MIKCEIFSNSWILMPGIIRTIMDLTHVTWIIVTTIHWLELKEIISHVSFLSQFSILGTRTYFSGFNRSCVQEAGHFDLFISDSVGIVVSIIRSTLPVLLTLPALLTNSKTIRRYIKFCNGQKMKIFRNKIISMWDSRVVSSH